MDRQARFQRAYQVALDTDAQGYTSRSSTDSTEERSVQELMALSWAAFESDLLPELDVAWRIQALDADDLLDRLKLGLRMLQDKKGKLEKRMQRAGLKFRKEDEDGDNGGKNDNAV